MKIFLITLLFIIFWFLSGFVAFYLDVKHISKITESTPMYVVNEEFTLCIWFGLFALFLAVILIIAELLKTPKEKFLKKIILRINKNR